MTIQDIVPLSQSEDDHKSIEYTIDCESSSSFFSSIQVHQPQHYSKEGRARDGNNKPCQDHYYLLVTW